MREDIIGKAQKSIDEKDERELIDIAERLLSDIKSAEYHLEVAHKRLKDFNDDAQLTGGWHSVDNLKKL